MSRNVVRFLLSVRPHTKRTYHVTAVRTTNDGCLFILSLQSNRFSARRVYRAVTEVTKLVVASRVSNRRSPSCGVALHVVRGTCTDVSVVPSAPIFSIVDDNHLTACHLVRWT